MTFSALLYYRFFTYDFAHAKIEKTICNSIIKDCVGDIIILRKVPNLPEFDLIIFSGGKCIEVDPNDYRIIMSKDWRRGGGVLVNVNLANHKGQFAYFFQIDGSSI